jgi:hypothetical protein
MGCDAHGVATVSKPGEDSQGNIAAYRSYFEESRRQDVANAIEQHAREAEEKAKAMSNDGKAPDLPGTKTLDYLGLGLLLATPAVVVDMFIKSVGIDWRKVAIAAVATCAGGGFAVWASHKWQAWRTSNNKLLPYLAAFESRFWGKAVIVALAMGFALALSSFLTNEKPNAPVATNQSNTADDIAKATGPIKQQLDESNKDLQNTRDIIVGLQGELVDMTRQKNALKGQLADVQKPQLQIGPQEALIISKYFGNPNVLPKDTRWAIFFTYPSENQKFYNTLIALMRDQLNPWILNAPDSSTDLDAPKFPLPPTESGITLHGDNALNTALSQILGQCFIVRRTDREIDGLSEWFTKRLSEPERAENRKITWIEIGQGSPWLQDNKRSTNCLQ